MIGRRLLHYEVLEKLGQGGMGVVYKAHDTHLDRAVALKVLPPDLVADSQRKLRFVQEAKAASSLNHPNIITIHDIAMDKGVDFIVMEYVAGKTLSESIPREGMPTDETLEYALQMAGALARAHGAGIIHRDHKPSNIMVDAHGVVKLLDFGLAKLTEEPSDDGTDKTRSLREPRTNTGVILGTLAYMSPEQAEGKPLDVRTDIFSFGAVLYEMVTGRRAFPGESVASVLAALLRENPTPLRQLTRGAPQDLERIIVRCLQKNRDARYPSMAVVVRDLEQCRSALQETSTGSLSFRRLWHEIRRPKFAIPAIAVMLTLTGVLTWLFQRNLSVRWARNQALPEIARLIDEDKFRDAYAVAEQAAKYIPNDPTLVRLWPAMSRQVTILTTPPGSEVYRRAYDDPNAKWHRAGTSPIENLRVPRGIFHWRIEKKGSATFEGLLFRGLFGPPSVSVTLDEQGTTPAGMVRVSTENRSVRLDIPGYEQLPSILLEDYWIDRYEVTNRQFKEFVSHGGYQKQEYWKLEFRKDGRRLSWNEAMILFRDATGRPGPKGWLQGEYPRGEDDYPVGGVSWYEAAAYAEFAGKALPTIWHWSKAAGTYWSAALVPASNFGGRGPAVVGSYRGLGPWGTYDTAGNVKEWCWNEASPGHRYILGGGWDEPGYMFEDVDARSPFERSPNFGFRCVKYGSANLVPEAATAAVPSLARDYKREKPASDELFRAYCGLYTYDKTPLHAVVESSDTTEHWRREKVTFAAAYGNERIIAYLFLPANFTPPLQTVVFFPGSNVILARSSANLNTGSIDFVIKSGRAVLYPVYKGTFERGDELTSDYPNTTSFWRDHVIAWSKDLSRAIDYLETRPEIDRERLAYYGGSWGAGMGAILPAIERRIKVCVLDRGGFYLQKALPEVDQINFAPRVQVPVLMLNGRYDYIYPLQTSQMPMYRLLGASAANKRHMLFEGGHNIPRNELIKETLDWLDRYLGPVKD